MRRPWLISKANRTSLNVEVAFQHILNDLYAFIATTLAGLVVLLTGSIVLMRSLRWWWLL